MDGLTGHVDLLSKLLDAANLRHNVIAQNVANVNTPGYRRLDVSFEDALARALGSQGEAKALAIKPEVVEGTPDVERPDGNTVDMDAEMGRLSKNTLLYRVFAQVLAGELATMRSAIAGR
jgi:flagellar basal-body rod protein FlgB